MLPQKEADYLITLPKKKVTDERYAFPLDSKILTIPILSLDETENFLIDINRGFIRLKCTYQKRYQKTIILVRVDLNGPPHTNPDVQKAPFTFLEPYVNNTIPTPHLHMYIEGFMDRWAVPIPEDKFSNVNDLGVTLVDFLKYCNVIEPPPFQIGLF